jgi:DnaJ family protein C protein 13
LPLLLQYDSTAENAQGIGNSVQTAKNMHAMLAVRALARLAGLLEDELYTPPNEIAAKALRAMLTPKLAALFSKESPRELLRNLNSNVESPQVCLESLKTFHVIYLFMLFGSLELTYVISNTEHAV